MQNNVCPITLESLDDLCPANIFVHDDVGFDLVALYEYLMTAPKFTNPLNRAPLTLADLERLEAQMKTVFGLDCICYKEDGTDQDENHCQDDENQDDQDDAASYSDMMSEGEINWLDDTELIARLNTSIMDVTTASNARVIRMRVDIDMHGIDLEMPPAVPALSASRLSPDTGVVGVEDDDLSHISESDLPPRRTFPSVTDMYKDVGREARMSERLSLLQYLEYDAMAILVQILDMAYDNHFHRYVWQHTSLDVMDTVTTYLSREGEGDGDGEDASAAQDQDPGQDPEDAHHRVITRITEPSPNAPTATDYDLEVVYTECWEVYRHVIIQHLERRYSETAADIAGIGVTDFRALFAAHRTLVRQRASEQEVNYDSVMDILDRIEDHIVPR